MLENLKAFVLQIVDHLKNRTEPMSDAVKEKLTSVLSMVRDKIQQLQAGEAAIQEEAPITPPSPFAVPESEELLWILAGGQPESFVQYISTFPDDDLRPLLRDPGQLQSRIQELQARNLIGEKGEADGVPQAPAQSSNIYGFKYNPKNRKLTVRFQEGGVYEYTGVPEFIYKIFEKGAVPAKTTGQNRFGRWWRGKSNPSYGAAFHELIKLGGYPFKRLR